MKKINILISCFFVFQFLLGCASGASKDTNEKANKVVIGYLPAWKDMNETMRKTDLSLLTHINIAFVNPDASGALLYEGEPVCSDATASSIKEVVKKAHENNIKVLVSLAGGVVPECSGDWKLLLQPSNRSTLISNLVKFTEYFNLDGIDVDIEGALLTSISDAGNYTPFIQELRNVLNPRGKLVTCATASYVGGMIPKSSIAYFDYINIMAYDNYWNSTKHHSTYQDAVRDMQMWLNLGCPANKLVLGVPFYAYLETVGSGSISYRDIIAQNPAAAQVDEFKNYKYNGIPTIEAKAEYALKYGAGIMIWEISQDSTDDLSLMHAIGKKIF